MTKAADDFLQKSNESDQLPDVFEFLASLDGLSPRAQVDVLLVDQFQRWKLNQVIPVDQYLSRTPDIEDILKVELLIEEYGYLDQRGIAPSPEEFAGRYVDISIEARQELFEALEIESVGELDSDSSGSHPSSPSGSSSKATPEYIGRYQVVRMLGKGSFGKVFLAKDPDLDRSVAIKVPTSQRVKLGGGAEEFLSEAKAVAKLDHPNIVPVYDCGMTDDERCFVVSKYVRGKELRAEMRKRIPHREAAWIIGCLARALHVAHGAGIVHRDVKPSNVIIDTKRQPHLLDFGLAYREQDASNSEAFVGTPAYMSPEQAEGGSHRVDGRSDIYSLAVIFYEMLTGHRPCKSEKTEDVLAQLKLGEVRPPRQSDDTIPVDLEQICLKALSRKLSDRYNTAKDMADDIEAWLMETSEGDDPYPSLVGAFGSSISHRSSRSSRRSANGASTSWRTPALLAGAVLLGLGSIVAFTNPPWKKSPSTPSTEQPTSETLASTEPPPAAPTVKLPRRVAVLGFRNLSEQPDKSENDWLATGLTELLTEELGKSNELNLITSENVTLMKAELDLSDSESLGASTLSRVNNRLQADWVVLGSFEVEDNESQQVRFNVSAQNTSDDQQLQFSNSAGLEQWTDLVALSSAQLRKELNLPAPSIVGTGEIFPSAPNANAAREYFKGVALLREFDPQAAMVAFESAAEADPESALIHNGLAQAAKQLGNENLARQHSERAVALCGTLPKHQQLSIKAGHSLLTGRPTDAVNHYRALTELRNQNIEGQLLLASAMISAGQGHEALKHLDEVRKRPLFGAAKTRVDITSAQAAQSVSNFAKQVEFATTAVESAKKIGARLLEGHASLAEGEGRRRVSQHNEAMVCYERAFKSFSKHGDQPNAAKTLTAWGKALIDNGELDLAEAKIEEASKISDTLSNERLRSKNKSLLGEVAIFRGRFDDAQKLLNEALEISTNSGDWQGVAGVNLTLANVLARTGKLDEALEMIGAARKAFQTTGNRLAEARTWGQEGAIRARTGDSIEAQRYFERALELFREVNDQRSIAICLGDLASTNSNQGNLTEAGKLYSEALELHRQLGSKRGPEMVMFNLGNLYERTGRFEESQKLISESHSRYEKMNRGMNAVFVKRKLADIQMKRGELEAAKQTADEVLAKSKEVGSLAVEGQCLYSMHRIDVYEGKFDEAIEHLKASRKLSSELKQSLNEFMCDYAIAYINLQMGDAEAADKLMSGVETKLVSLQPELKPMLLYFRARTQARLGKTESAETTFKAADAAHLDLETEDLSILLVRQHERAQTLDALGKTDEAITEMKAVADLANEYGWRSLEWEAATQHLEMLHTANRQLPTDELSALIETLSNQGFTAFAERLEHFQSGPDA